MDQAEILAYYGSFEGCNMQSLRQDYLFAKRRFRRFAGSQPRSHRFPRRPASWDLRFGGKGRHGWSRGKSKGKGYYAGLPFGPSSFAGGMGKGKGKKGKGKDRGRGRGA